VIANIIPLIALPELSMALYGWFVLALGVGLAATTVFVELRSRH